MRLFVRRFRFHLAAVTPEPNHSCTREHSEHDDVWAASLLHSGRGRAKSISHLMFQTRKPDDGCGPRSSVLLAAGWRVAGMDLRRGEKNEIERDTTWLERE